MLALKTLPSRIPHSKTNNPDPISRAAGPSSEIISAPVAVVGRASICCCVMTCANGDTGGIGQLHSVLTAKALPDVRSKKRMMLVRMVLNRVFFRLVGLFVVASFTMVPLPACQTKKSIDFMVTLWCQIGITCVWPKVALKI